MTTPVGPAPLAPTLGLLLLGAYALAATVAGGSGRSSVTCRESALKNAVMRSRLGLQVVLATIGTVATVAGATAVVQGTANVVQGGDVSPNIDSEFRFYAS